MASIEVKNKVEKAFAHQAGKLSLQPHVDNSPNSTTAVEAKFITPLDPVIETTDGQRLPAVPLAEAQRLNQLKDEVDGQSPGSDSTASGGLRQTKQQQIAQEVTSEDSPLDDPSSASPAKTNGYECRLDTTLPPSRTHPLFPPLPLYGPPSMLRNLQCKAFRVSSFFLSLGFLAVIVLGSAFTSIPLMFRHIGLRLTFRNPDARRPFYEEEKRRRKVRREATKKWKQQRRRRRSQVQADKEKAGTEEDFEPTEGGNDPIICDVGYYARRVGLDVETFKVQTEDGFVIVLWHVYNPKEYTPVAPKHRNFHEPLLFPPHLAQNGKTNGASGSQHSDGNRRYPVLLMHGLLQSAGSYCTNDDDSLAFFLCKSGYDVWLGNNRCGFEPQHTMLEYSDPRMWAWNIRQMGVMDLPALVSRVLSETGFEKLGLVCHSQGTTETFVALAKEQRPDIGEKISVFCALAPAAYAGPLIGKMYFKFMRVISPGMFRIFFGIHAFIPFMMAMHSLLPGRLYGALGYRVFSFLFNWTDDRWERDIRDRLFQFAPVYVSAESMRWWLGRECFARQKCILATKEEGKMEEVEDEVDEEEAAVHQDHPEDGNHRNHDESDKPSPGHTAWYNEQAPPFAFWVCGSDDLVDGRRLLRRFEKGREPHVRVVHSKIIEEYEHLDVIWAMDSIEKVGKEVREVIWKTAPMEARAICRVPKGCNEVEF